jgi:Domain of unknown function (DUF5069)
MRADPSVLHHFDAFPLLYWLRLLVLQRQTNHPFRPFPAATDYRLPITDYRYRLSPMADEKLLQLAPDLTRVAPRSPRTPLGAYGVLAARMLDKCRAELAGKGGDYHFNCPMDQVFFRFTKIDPQKFKEFVASGASDEEVARWIELNSKVQDPGKIATWARLFRLNPFTLLLDPDDWIHTRRAAGKD